MNFCGWTYIGPINWWELLTPEAKAGWVSAWGTVIAAGIAAGVYIGTNRRNAQLRKEDAAAAKTERDLRERIVLQYVLSELRSIAMRMEDVIVCCRKDGRHNVIAKAAFIHSAFITEKHGLESLRPSLTLVPPEMALRIAICEAQIAIFNTEVRSLEATWAAIFANQESMKRGRRSDFLQSFNMDEFGIDEMDARTMATLARTIAVQVQLVALPIIGKLELDDPNWKAVFDRCASHAVPLPVTDKDLNLAPSA